MASTAAMANAVSGQRLPGICVSSSFRWLFLFALLLLFQSPALFAAEDINALRKEQQVELKNLESRYHAKVRENPDLIKADGTVDSEHPEYKQILADYSQEKAGIQEKFNERDSRGAELNDLKTRYGSSLKTTGSAPKDVRADVDITANDPRVAEQIAKDMGGFEYNPELGIYINKEKDITLWQPPTQEQLANRQKYHDAFSTPGGKQATEVKGSESVRDPEGYVLDNEKKFIHAAEDLNKSDIKSQSPDEQMQRDMALKTMGKSVSKAAGEVDHDSKTIGQAKALRNYGDKFETGITPLGATPEQQQADEKNWIGQADQALQNTKPVAEEKSQQIRQVREQVAKTADKTAAKSADPDAKETAANIRGRNQMLQGANEDARTANDDARKQAGLPAAPEPDQKAVAQQAAESAQRAAKKTAPAATTTTRAGSSKNSSWRISEQRDGDKRTRNQSSTTRNADGSITQRDSQTETRRSTGGGTRSEQNRRVTTTGSDGSSSDSKERTTKYEGKKASSSATKTSTTERDAKGQVTRQTDSSKTTNTRTGKSGTNTSSHEKSTTRQEYKGWRPGSSGSTTTETSKTRLEHKQGGQTRTSESETSTTTDDRTGRQSTVQIDSSSTTSKDDEGRETTTKVTTTTTDKPWQKSRTTEGVYEKDLKPGGDPNEPADGERVGDPTKFNVKIAGGKLFEPVDHADKTAATSGAGQTESGGDYGYDAKIQTGQYGASGNWEVTANKRGLHAKADVNLEANAVKMTATGSAEQKVGDATLGAKVSTTAKVGAEGKGSAEVHLGSDRVATSLEAKAFVGGKAETAAEASLSLWGLKLTGKAQAEVSVGAGAEAKVDAELSWTKIRLGGKVAATLGLGGGGSTSVELDGTELITGHDLAALERQFQAGDSIVKICRDLRSGRLRLPPGVKFSDIRERLQQKAELYAKYPQLTKDGKPISLVDSLIDELGLTKGKSNSYVTAHHKQQDWYCTNRPQIEAKVVLPAIVERRP